MTLTDAYCLYNRARGTDLVSPGDLREAAELLSASSAPPSSSRGSGGGLGGVLVGITLRVFPSGLQVLQLADFSEDAAAGRIERLLRARSVAAAAADGAALTDLAASPYLTALDLATQWAVPLPIAEQLLLGAEARGRLARDDSISGLRFYLNLFLAAAGG